MALSPQKILNLEANTILSIESFGNGIVSDGLVAEGVFFLPPKSSKVIKFDILC